MNSAGTGQKKVPQKKKEAAMMIYIRYGNGYVHARRATLKERFSFWLLKLYVRLFDDLGL